MKKAIDNIFGISFIAMTIPTFFMMIDESLPATALCVACLVTLSAISFHSSQED